MTQETSENLPNEVQLALAYTAPQLRDALRIFFELDARLARIVAGTNEVMLGQMRLAWWRDMLGQNADQRPQGDAVLDGIGTHWGEEANALIALVDGWEYMLSEDFDAEAALQFASNRAKSVTALARMAGGSEERAESHAKTFTLWALADAAANISDAGERETLLDLASSQPKDARPFPKPLRGLNVLMALARRSVAHGGRPLMEGRGAALTAMRAAILGR